MNPFGNSTILVTALVYGLLLQVASFSLFGLLLLIILLLSLFRYGYAVLRDVAHGKPKLRPPAIETVNWFDGMRLAMHSVLFFLAAYFLATTPLFGAAPLVTVLRWLLLGGLLFTFPASAASMAISGDLADAINPRSVMQIIAAMGSRYWALAGMCVGLSLLIIFSKTVLAASSIFFAIFSDCVAVWLYLAMFASIGSAIGEFRGVFELRGEPELRMEQVERQRDRDRQWYLDRAYTSIRSGLLAQGYRSLKELIDAEDGSVEIYQWLLDRTLTWDDQSHALRVAERFVERLIELGRQQQALDLVQHFRRVSADFKPSSDSAAALARYARGAGWHRIADELEALSASARTQPR